MNDHTAVQRFMALEPQVLSWRMLIMSGRGKYDPEACS